MITLYAIFLCYAGSCHVDPFGQVFHNAAACRAAKGYVAQRLPRVKVICMKRSAPAWGPAG